MVGLFRCICLELHPLFLSILLLCVMLHNQFKAEDQTVDLSPEDESVHYLSNGHKTAYMVIDSNIM